MCLIGLKHVVPIWEEALWPTQPPIQWVPGALFLGIKLPVREADHSPHLVSRSVSVELYFHSPNTPSWRGDQLKKKAQGQLLKDIVDPMLWLITTPWRRIGEWRYSSTHSLTSALDGGEWSASRSGRFILRERALGTHWIGGWVGPRAGPDAVAKRKKSQHCPRREPNTGRPARAA
jgi:hypothetical protein